MGKVIIKEYNGVETITVEQDGKTILRYQPEPETRERLLAKAVKLAETGFTKFEDDGLEVIKPDTKEDDTLVRAKSKKKK